MPIILLVRHGETDWNRSGQIMGDRPVPLNQHGKDQAHQLATCLKDRRIQTVYSSPVTRAVQTAEILASVLGACVTVLPGLSEIGVGEWAVKFWKDLADEPVKQNYYIKPHEARPPGGETLAEVQARAVAAIEEACRNGTCEPFLFVSHADVIRSVLAHYLRLDFIGLRQARIDHGSLTALRLVEGAAELLCLNYTPSTAGLSL